MQCVILAAGKGTRLHPVTHLRTKAMAPVAGKPMVERVLALFTANGVRDFILIVSPDDEDIRRHFAEPAAFGTDSIRLVPQHERLGMAHALKLAVPFLQGDFVLTACDNLVPANHIADLIEAHRTRGASATLSLMEIDPLKTASTGIVERRNGQIVRIVEKPQPEDAPSNISSLPLYLFSPKLLPCLANVQPSPRGEYELQDAIQMLIDEVGEVTGVLTESRRQLTNVDDLLALNQHFLRQEASMQDVGSNGFGPGTRLLPPVRIDDGVLIGRDCVIGPHVVIEAGCHIGDGAVIEDAVVLRNRTVEPGSHIKNRVVATVPENINDTIHRIRPDRPPAAAR